MQPEGVLQCTDHAPRGGAGKVISRIDGPVVIRKILDVLKSKEQACQPFPSPESRAPMMGLFA